MFRNTRVLHISANAYCIEHREHRNMTAALLNRCRDIVTSHARSGCAAPHDVKRALKLCKKVTDTLSKQV